MALNEDCDSDGVVVGVRTDKIHFLLALKVKLLSRAECGASLGESRQGRVVHRSGPLRPLPSPPCGMREVEPPCGMRGDVMAGCCSQGELGNEVNEAILCGTWVTRLSRLLGRGFSPPHRRDMDIIISQCSSCMLWWNDNSVVWFWCSSSSTTTSTRRCWQLWWMEEGGIR